MALSSAVCLHASTLSFASDAAQGNIGSSGTDAYYGQGFTVSGAGSYDDITFNFFTYTSSTQETPYALGTGYLFSTPYAGTVAGLSSGAGLLGSVAAANDVYTFASGLSLAAGSTYYFYEDGGVPDSTMGGVQPGSLYYTYGGSQNFTPLSDFSTAYAVNGNSLSASPTPEPSSFALLGTGLLGVAGVVRKRFA